MEYVEAKKKYFFAKKKNVCKVMPLRKVPNTEDNEEIDHRFDFSVNDSVSFYQLHYYYCVICAHFIAWLLLYLRPWMTLETGG